jgi:hypothetical protein
LFSSFSTMLAVCHIWPSLYWGMFFLFLISLGLHKGMLNFVKGFFYIYRGDHLIFVLDSVYVVYYIYWFALFQTILASLEWNQLAHDIWSF